MPSVNFHLYDTFRENAFSGDALDFESPGGNGIKCALVTSAYTPNQNTHEFFSQVTGQVSGAGYTAGGNVMANGTVTLSGAGLVTVDLDDPAVWAQDSGGFSNAQRAVVYHDTGNPATSRLIGYSESFGSDMGNVNGDFSIVVNPNGLFVSER